jgi:hypothetical protein
MGIKNLLVDLCGPQTAQQWKRAQHGAVLSMSSEVGVPRVVSGIMYEQTCMRAPVGLMDRAVACAVACASKGQSPEKATLIFEEAKRFVLAVAYPDRGKCVKTANIKEQESNLDFDLAQFEVMENPENPSAVTKARHSGMRQILTTEEVLAALDVMHYSKMESRMRIAS